MIWESYNYSDPYSLVNISNSAPNWKGTNTTTIKTTTTTNTNTNTLKDSHYLIVHKLMVVSVIVQHMVILNKVVIVVLLEV